MASRIKCTGFYAVLRGALFGSFRAETFVAACGGFMAGGAVRMVIDDPSKFHILTADMKMLIIQGAINTVNMQAALARKNAVSNVKENFTLRNSFTVRQIKYEQMPARRFVALSKIQARAGVTEKAAWMARQETGGTRAASKEGGNLAIASAAARGGNLGSAVLKKHRLSKAKIVNKAEGGSFIRRAAAASETGALVYRRGLLFAISGFDASGSRPVFKMDLIYNMRLKSTETPEKKWLLPAAEKSGAACQSIFVSQMKKLGL